MVHHTPDVDFGLIEIYSTRLIIYTYRMWDMGIFFTMGKSSSNILMYYEFELFLIEN